MIKGMIDKLRKRWDLKEDVLNARNVGYVIKFLEAYGYLTGKEDSVGKIIKAIKLFQAMYGLKTDGWAGPKTLKAMNQKRCGCSDLWPKRSVRKQMTGGGISPWNKRVLTYAFESHVQGISKNDQEKAFQDACSLWSMVANVRFEQVSLRASHDIRVGVGRGRRDNFDGKLGTLAYTYLRRSWDMRKGPIPLLFDFDETWVLDPRNRGTYYTAVAAHEIGHVGLDLEHSAINSALMAPIYNPLVSTPQSPDDKERAIRQFGESKWNGDSTGGVVKGQQIKLTGTFVGVLE